MSTKSTKKTSKRIRKLATTAPKQDNKLRILTAVACAFQLIASILLIQALSKLNLLQGWQFVIAIVIMFAFQFLTAKQAISKNAKRALRIFAIVVALILGGIYVCGAHYARKTTNFIQGITGVHYETQTYEVRVLKSSGFNEIAQLRNQHVGFMTTNPNLEDTKTNLKSAVNYKAQDFEDLGTMISSIYAFETAAVVLNDSYTQYIEESDSEFINDSKVIYSFEVNKVADDEPVRVDVANKPFIVYISGSDSRGKISDVARSDVNMLMVINPQTGKILLVNIPRDYYVQLHGTTGMKDKLTHAGIYGVNKSKTTIEDLLGIEINYTVKVGFNTVIKVVDAIGGIDIFSDKEFTAWTNKTCHFKYGTQHVDSTCALAFSRERYTYAAGDRHRGENQQAVITAIINKMSDPKYMLKYSDILSAAEGSFETNLSYDEITGFAKQQLSALKHWEVESIALDGTGASLPTYSMGSQKLYVMIPNQATIDAAKAKIDEYLKTPL